MAKIKTKIKKGDMVEVIAGNDVGKRGRVVKVDPKTNRIVVEGVNVRTKHRRENQVNNRTVQAGIIKFEAPIHISNVMLVSPKGDELTRVGFEERDGKKVRISRSTGDAIS